VLRARDDEEETAEGAETAETIGFAISAVSPVFS